MRTSRERAAVPVLMIVMTLIAGPAARAQEQRAARPDTGEVGHVMRLTPEELTWTAGPPMLPPGVRMAPIEGAPHQPGPFTFRLRFPPDYKIPAHWHPTKVTVTVISGTFNMGLGDELDTAKGKMLPAGSIFEMPARIHHFGWTKEETVIQEHGIGPLKMEYLNPSDDPRHK
jgi:quercetin dioxygenase-like cupin family protein